MRLQTRTVLWVALGFLVVAVGAFFFWKRIESNPDVRLLFDHGGAKWIRFPDETSLRLRPLGENWTSFRADFEIDSSVSPDAQLFIQALTDAAVQVNDALVLKRHHAPDTWKSERQVHITPYLRLGENTVRIDVFTTHGPRVLWARCEALGLRTGDGWEASEAGGEWVAAVAADSIEPSAISRLFIEPWRAFLRALPLIVVVFLLVLIAQFVWARKTDSMYRAIPDARERVPPGRYACIGVMGAVLVLGVNNAFKLPMITGFDIEGHINYIHYVATRGALPLAHEGWQMFQSPLYYLLSAGPYWALSKAFDVDVIVKALRIVSILCSVAQVEVAYRVARRVFPDRDDLHVAAALFAGVLPMNLYISQYIGNEPLAGLLSALVCLQCVLLLTQDPDAKVTTGSAMLLGLLLGLAVLTKVTAVLLILPCLAVLAHTVSRVRPLDLRRVAASLGGFSLILTAVCSWYFLRNWTHYGKPFVGGWEVARDIVWWQDPGYRTVSQMVTFGESLVRPITAGTAGMLDAFYSTFWLDGLLSSMVEFEHRPAWNYVFVVSGAWLAVVPAVLIGVGLVASLATIRPRGFSPQLFALGCVAIYFAAFAYLFLALPTYSTGKATYTLGVLPLYALLFATGLNAVPRESAFRRILIALVAVWACTAYAAYFVA